MTSKYNKEIIQEDFEKEINRLTNQLWKLIPMRENGEDWNRQLENVIVEIVGIQEIINYETLGLLEILEGLNKQDVEFSIYRKLIFESISLLRKLVLNAG